MKQGDLELMRMEMNDKCVFGKNPKETWLIDVDCWLPFDLLKILMRFDIA